MVENGKFLKRLRNDHLEKPAVTGLFHPSRSPKTAKTPAKVHLRLRFQNPGKPRTAGLCIDEISYWIPDITDLREQMVDMQGAQMTERYRQGAEKMEAEYKRNLITAQEKWIV